MSIDEESRRARLDRRGEVTPRMRNEKKEYFADWLDRTLLERGLAGGDVAKALQVNDSAISRWRNGKASPGLGSVMRLANYLDVHPIRLAVTAGLMSESDAGEQPLPLPAVTRTRAMIVSQIDGIKGLTQDERDALVRAYEKMSDNKEEKVDQS